MHSVSKLFRKISRSWENRTKQSNARQALGSILYSSTIHAWSGGPISVTLTFVSRYVSHTLVSHFTQLCFVISTSNFQLGRLCQSPDVHAIHALNTPFMKEKRWETAWLFVKYVSCFFFSLASRKSYHLHLTCSLQLEKKIKMASATAN